MLIQKNMPRTKRGFTLTEAAIVLGIVGLILGAIWVAAASVYRNMRITRTTEQILTIVQSIRSMNTTQQTLGGTANYTLPMIQAGIFPRDMIRGTGASATANNQWDGLVTVTGATATVAGDAFALAYVAVPQSACIDLAVRMSGPARDGGLIGIAAGAVNNTTFPVNVVNAATLCPNATNTITFTFRLKA